MGRANADVHFGSPQRGKQIASKPSGRLCVMSGCETILSTYNHAVTCSLHSPPDFRKPRKV